MITLRSRSAAAQVVGDAVRAGRDPVVVPAGDDKPETLALFAEVLGFPRYFGHNLDALADSLRSYVKRRQSVDIVWSGPGLLRSGDPRTYAAIMEILDALGDGERVAVTVLID